MNIEYLVLNSDCSTIIRRNQRSATRATVPPASADIGESERFGPLLRCVPRQIPRWRLLFSPGVTSILERHTAHTRHRRHTVPSANTTDGVKLVAVSPAK